MKRPLPLRHNLAPSGIAASKTSLCKNIHDKLQWKETTHNLSLIFRFQNQIGPQNTCSCLLWSYIIHCSHFTLFATIPPSVLLTWIPDLPVTSLPPLRSAPITTSGETLHRSVWLPLQFLPHLTSGAWPLATLNIAPSISGLRPITLQSTPNKLLLQNDCLSRSLPIQTQIHSGTKFKTWTKSQGNIIQKIFLQI